MKKHMAGMLVLLLVCALIQPVHNNTKISKIIDRFKSGQNAETLLSLRNLPIFTGAAADFNVDQANRTITITPVGDVTASINSAMQFLINRPDQDAVWTVNFAPGEYLLTKPIFADKLTNVTLLSSQSSPAKFIKSSTFNGEYIFYSRFGKNITLKGFEFYGKSKVYKPENYLNSSNPVWTDQGLYFASCNVVNVHYNKFYDFGNAALRVTTSENDTKTGINSYNTNVTNNKFYNIFQTSTTSNSQVHGATSHYLFQANEFFNLRESVKFASRTPGAVNLKIRVNKIHNSDHAGIVVCCYSNFEISGNIISNVKGLPINIYTNEQASTGFNWGDNMLIKNNRISNSYIGIRVSFNKFKDGYTFTPKLVSLMDNTISDIYDEFNPKSTNPAMYVINGKVDGLAMTGNKLYRIASKSYFGLTGGTTGINVSNNFVDDESYNIYKVF